MLYLIQTTAYTALLYALYALVLKNRAAHYWARAYLLLCAVLPAVLPFIKIQSIHAAGPVSAKAITMLLPAANAVQKTVHVTTSSADQGSMLWAVYAAVSAILLLWSLLQLLRFMRFVHENKCEAISDVKVMLGTNAGPGSFQNYIFLPGASIDPAIFEHELAHVRLKHSYDLMLIRILCVLFWPNVVLYLIARELKIVHEFQADACAGRNNGQYVSTLLNNTFDTKLFSLAHAFAGHPLKRRIKMLGQLPMGQKKLVATIVSTALPAAIMIAGVVYLQSCSQPVRTTAQDDTVIVFRQGADTAAVRITEERTDLPKPVVNKAKIEINTNGETPAKDTSDRDRAHTLIKQVTPGTANKAAGNNYTLTIPGAGKGTAALNNITITDATGKGVNGTVYVNNNSRNSPTYDLADMKSGPGAAKVMLRPNDDPHSFTLTGATGKDISEATTIEIDDPKGNKVYEAAATAPKGNLNEKINLPDNDVSGMYVLYVRSASFNEVLHVLLSK